MPKEKKRVMSGIVNAECAGKKLPLGRFELPTSRLLSARSDQLSYRGRSHEDRMLLHQGETIEYMMRTHPYCNCFLEVYFRLQSPSRLFIFNRSSHSSGSQRTRPFPLFIFSSSRLYGPHPRMPGPGRSRAGPLGKCSSCDVAFQVGPEGPLVLQSSNNTTSWEIAAATGAIFLKLPNFMFISDAKAAHPSHGQCTNHDEHWAA
jgi:hypothetical protein